MGQSSRPLSEEQLDGILSPELDKMVTDGKAFICPPSGLSKDMQKCNRIFRDVCMPINFCSGHSVTNTVLYPDIDMVVVNIPVSLFSPRSNSQQVI